MRPTLPFLKAQRALLRNNISAGIDPITFTTESPTGETVIVQLSKRDAVGLAAILDLRIEAATRTQETLKYEASHHIPPVRIAVGSSLAPPVRPRHAWTPGRRS